MDLVIEMMPICSFDYDWKQGIDFVIPDFWWWTNFIQFLQTLVYEQGYSESWTVVVRSISDDIGNTAATLTKDFTVKATVVSSGFLIQSKENGFVEEGVFAFDATEKGGKDRLEITFTKGVNVAGEDNLTSVYNWTLNGNQLSKLSNVESIKVEDVNGNTKDGYEKVVITFADDRAFGASSNVVSVTKGIKSLDGTVLSGEFEVVAHTINLELQEATDAVAKAESDQTQDSVNAAQELVTALPAGAEKDALQQRLDAIGVAF